MSHALSSDDSDKRTSLLYDYSSATSDSVPNSTSKDKQTNRKNGTSSSSSAGPLASSSSSFACPSKDSPDERARSIKMGRSYNTIRTSAKQDVMEQQRPFSNSRRDPLNTSNSGINSLGLSRSHILYDESSDSGEHNVSPYAAHLRAPQVSGDDSTSGSGSTTSTSAFTTRLSGIRYNKGVPPTATTTNNNASYASGPVSRLRKAAPTGSLNGNSYFFHKAGDGESPGTSPTVVSSSGIPLSQRSGRSGTPTTAMFSVGWEGEEAKVVTTGNSGKSLTGRLGYLSADVREQRRFGGGKDAFEKVRSSTEVGPVHYDQASPNKYKNLIANKPIVASDDDQDEAEEIPGYTAVRTSSGIVKGFDSKFRKQARSYSSKVKRPRFPGGPRNNQQKPVFQGDEDEETEDDNKRLAGYCNADAYDMQRIIEAAENKVDAFLQAMGTFGVLKGTSDVVRIKDKNHHKYLFIFEFGCLVFFNFSKLEELAISNHLRTYQIGLLSHQEIDNGYEELNYVTDSAESAEFRAHGDTVILTSKLSMQKLSIAYALAQAVKLNVFEVRVEMAIKDNEDLAYGLAVKGESGLNKLEMSKKLGHLFNQRNNIFFSSDILDTPEFFWEQGQFKKDYDYCYKFLECSKRSELLNMRLDIIKDLFDILTDGMDRTHMNKLDVIIIYLLVINVLIDVVWDVIIMDVLKLFGGVEDN